MCVHSHAYPPMSFCCRSCTRHALIVGRSFLIRPLLAVAALCWPWQSWPSPMLTSRILCRPTRSAVVGEVDEELDAELDLAAIVAEPLKPVVH